MVSIIIGGIALAVPSGKAAAAPAAIGASCQKGEKLILTTAHTTDALGVTRYTYRALPGFTSRLASRRLTGSRVTEAVIKDLGLRATPNLTTAQARRIITGESRTPPWFCLSAALPGAIHSAALHSKSGSTAPSAVDGTNVNGSWAGVAVTSGEFGAPINSVYGEFPTTTATVPKVNSLTYEWVGVGDFGQQTALIQAGVQTLSVSGSRTLKPFLEYINATVQGGCCGLIAGNAVGTGIDMAVDVYWTSATNACFLVLNTSSGTFPVNSCVNVSQYGVQHDTSSAEWFMEDALPAGWYYENVNQVPWTFMSLSEEAQLNPRWHSPFNYNYMVYQIAATAADHKGVATCQVGSGPNGILSYPVHEANTNAADGQMDTNTNAVNGCTSG